MDIKKEIVNFSDPADRECLLWLFSQYHWSSQWHFVAKCRFKRHGPESYAVNRIWTPSKEGRMIYEYTLNQGYKDGQG